MSKCVVPRCILLFLDQYIYSMLLYVVRATIFFSETLRRGRPSHSDVAYHSASLAFLKNSASRCRGFTAPCCRPPALLQLATTAIPRCALPSCAALRPILRRTPVCLVRRGHDVHLTTTTLAAPGGGVAGPDIVSRA
jgi:hypothetical protein